MRSIRYWLAALVAVPALAGAQAGPEAWVREAYAPLWQNASAVTADIAPVYYHDPVAYHPADGRFQHARPGPWLEGLLAGWATSGWAGSTLDGYRQQRINDRTWALTMRWRDRYPGGAAEHSCGWYLAARVDGGWKFTAYAPVECSEVF